MYVCVDERRYNTFCFGVFVFFFLAASSQVRSSISASTQESVECVAFIFKKIMNSYCLSQQLQEG